MYRDNEHSISAGLRALIITLCLAFGAGGMLIGCEQQGPAEEAGENVDEAMDEAGESMEEAAEKVEDEIDDATDGG